MSEDAALRLAGTYRRCVNASLARIWENVFDWEHLAHLHDGSFADCVLLDDGPWGWRVTLTPVGGAAQVVELRADRTNQRYTSTTIDGPGAGTQIRVALTPRAARTVDVLVEFHLPETRPDRLAALGEAYAAIYARLWDEDEAMMQARERALAQRSRSGGTTPPLDLGDSAAVRESLPLVFEMGGAPFRLIDFDGRLIAHSTICPHWLGPLDEVSVINGKVRCPWHGYRFDVIGGTCAEHPKLKLAFAPTIRVVDGRVIAGDV